MADNSSKVVKNNQGKIISFCSFAGGVGKTVLAVNLAVELALKYPEQKVILLDLNLYNSDIAAMLNIKINYKYSLKQYFTQDEVDIDKLILPYDNVQNLSILSNDNDFTWFDCINPERLNELFADIQKRHDYILVDTHTAIDIVPAYIPMTLSQKLVWVITPTIPNLRSITPDRIARLRAIGLGGDICLAVNRYDSVKEISTEVLVKETGLKPVFNISENSQEILTSINQGIPLAFCNNNSKQTSKTLPFIKGKNNASNGIRQEIQTIIPFITDFELEPEEEENKKARRFTFWRKSTASF